MEKLHKENFVEKTKKEIIDKIKKDSNKIDNEVLEK